MVHLRPLRLARYASHVSCALAVLAFAALGSPARADEATDLLAKHASYAGWTFSDDAFKSLVIDGTVSRKRGVEHFHWTIRGSAFRETHEDAGLERSYGFDGSRFWRSDENGFVARLNGVNAEYLAAWALVFNEGTTQLKAQVLGHQSLGGVNVAVVRVQTFPEVSLPTDLYIDPSSGAYKRVVIGPGLKRPVVIDVLAEMEPIAGKKIVSRWTRHGETFEITRAAANLPIETTDLNPPTPSALWTFGNSNPIPIAVSDKGIEVTARINGVEGHFLFDSGASSIAVTDSFAQRAGLQPIAEIPFEAIGGSDHATLARARTFE